MIVTKHLKKCYENIVAVEDLNLEVPTGEVLGLLGPNGAGKSTTIKMLAGFLTPTSGSVEIFGQNMAENSLAIRKKMGYLPEGAPAYGEMSAKTYLNFIADIRGLSGSVRQNALDRVKDELHLKRVWNQPIETLSKGFKRRVGLAQAILHNPQVLLLDEPTDGLDPNQKHEVRQLIQNMSDDRIILISTHILEEVDALCTRATIIASGKVVADETPEELLQRSRYHHAVTLKLEQPACYQTDIQALQAVSATEINLETEEITVFAHKGESIFLPLQQKALQENWPVESIQLESGRLDEVFRHITTGELN